MAKPRITDSYTLSQQKAVSFNGTKKITLDDALNNIAPVYREYFDKLYQYVSGMDGVKSYPSKSLRVTFRYKAKPFIRLFVKRGVPVVAYSFKEDVFRKLKMEANAKSVSIKEKESEITIDSWDAYSIALKIIDMRIDQIENDLIWAHDKRLESARNKKVKAIADLPEAGANDKGNYDNEVYGAGDATGEAQEEIAASIQGSEIKPIQSILPNGVVKIELRLDISDLLKASNVAQKP